LASADDAPIYGGVQISKGPMWRTGRKGRRARYTCVVVFGSGVLISRLCDGRATTWGERQRVDGVVVESEDSRAWWPCQMGVGDGVSDIR
jgi:hypothetical protein